MFGLLKKKLQETIKKVSKKIIKEEKLEKEEKPIEEEVIEEVEKKIEDLEEIEEKLEEERIAPEVISGTIEAEKIFKEIKEEKVIEEIKEKKKGIFPKLIKKVVEKKLSESDIEKILKELQIVLLENDTAIEVAEKICDDVKKELIDKSVKRGKAEDVIKSALRNAILNVMKQEKLNLEKLIEEKELFTILVLGFNGTGKTTTVAKLAYKFKKFNPVVAAGDTFRTASIEQLEEHGKKIGIDVIKHKYGADSAAVIFDAKKHALSIGSKLVIADTAGRSHANVNLMDELKKVCRVNKPDMKILVLDALTGNDIFDQSKLFNDAVGVDAIILTKVDVYEKGGAALSAAYTIKKPILFLGVGQNYGDLKEFDAEEIVNNLMT